MAWLIASGEDGDQDSYSAGGKKVSALTYVLTYTSTSLASSNKKLVNNTKVNKNREGGGCAVCVCVRVLSLIHI